MRSDARQRIIREAINEQLSADAIQSVQIEEASDSDGEPILKITIVLTKRGALLARKKMVGLPRTLREKINDDRLFPIIDFISESDAKRKRAAA